MIRYYERVPSADTFSHEGVLYANGMYKLELIQDRISVFATTNVHIRRVAFIKNGEAYLEIGRAGEAIAARCVPFGVTVVVDREIHATIEGDDFRDCFSFSTEEVMAHYLPKHECSWDHLSEQDRLSFAQGFALWWYARRFENNRNDLHVTIEVTGENAQ